MELDHRRRVFHDIEAFDGVQIGLFELDGSGPTLSDAGLEDRAASAHHDLVTHNLTRLCVVLFGTPDERREKRGA